MILFLSDPQYTYTIYGNPPKAILTLRLLYHWFRRLSLSFRGGGPGGVWPSYLRVSSCRIVGSDLQAESLLFRVCAGFQARLGVEWLGPRVHVMLCLAFGILLL